MENEQITHRFLKKAHCYSLQILTTTTTRYSILKMQNKTDKFYTTQKRSFLIASEKDITTNMEGNVAAPQNTQRIQRIRGLHL